MSTFNRSAKILTLAVILGQVSALSFVMAQEGGAPPPPASDNAKSTSTLVSEVASFFSGFDYDPRGRRDPFSQPIDDVPVTPGAAHGPLLPLQRYELNQLRLTGILWDVRSPKALLQDPDGKVHLITPNTKIGPRNGYVAVIREGEIVVVETVEQDGRLVSTAQVVKIAR